MKTASCKNKGRILQKYVVSKILEYFPFLTDRDVTNTSMGCSGVDVKLSETAHEVFPYAIECKAQESLNIWSAIKQAEENSKGDTPIVVFKRNRSKTYVCLEFTQFMSLTRALDSIIKLFKNRIQTND